MSEPRPHFTGPASPHVETVLKMIEGKPLVDVCLMHAKLVGEAAHFRATRTRLRASRPASGEDKEFHEEYLKFHDLMIEEMESMVAVVAAAIEVQGAGNVAQQVIAAAALGPAEGFMDDLCKQRENYAPFLQKSVKATRDLLGKRSLTHKRSYRGPPLSAIKDLLESELQISQEMVRLTTELLARVKLMEDAEARAVSTTEGEVANEEV